MRLSVTLIISFAILLVACNKGRKDSALTAKEILTTRDWLFSEFKENGVVMPFNTPCDTDDFITFNINGTYIKDDGAVKCNAGDAQTFTDGWYLSADEKSLNILSEVQGELLAISETSFTIRRTGANVFDYTYVKK